MRRKPSSMDILFQLSFASARLIYITAAFSLTGMMSPLYMTAVGCGTFGDIGDLSFLALVGLILIDPYRVMTSFPTFIPRSQAPVNF